MILKSKEISKKFIPEFRGNRELPPGEQIVIIFSRIPGQSERSDYISIKMSPDKSIELVYNDLMLLTAFIDRIDNLSDEVNGVITPIRTGKQLSQLSHPGLADLFMEIRNYLFPDERDGWSAGESIA